MSSVLSSSGFSSWWLVADEDAEAGGVVGAVLGLFVWSLSRALAVALLNFIV